MTRACRLALSLLLVLWAAPAAADGLSGLKVSPSPAKAGQKITVTLEGTIDPGKKCRFYYKLAPEPFKDTLLGDVTSLPHSFEVSFAKAGTKYIHVWSGTTGENPCPSGFQKQAQLVVEARMVAQVTPRVSGPCPPGWVVKAQEAGGFLSCVPRKPATKIQCPSNTQYFETECAIGCQPVPR